MNCPICNHSNLPDGASVCPQCNSDLEMFSHINTLDAQLKKQKQLALVLGGLLLVSMIACIMLFSKGKNEMPPPANTDEMAKLKSENVQLQAGIADLKKQMEEKEKQMQAAPAGTVASGSHVVQKGESLWTIAQKELGDGNKYMQIAKENNLANPDKLPVGMELKITK